MFELEDTMKIQVKETLARRLTVVVLTLAAIVGVCAFTFSGTQNYAWAEGEEPIATWTSVPEPGVGGVPAKVGKNLTLEIKVASSSDHLEAHFTNNDGDTIPPSVLELTTEDGSVLTAYFGDDIPPTNQAASSIEGSNANTRFISAELYLMPEKVTVSFESEFGTAPEAKTVNKGEIVELPNLGTEGDYTFVGWIMKGSEGTDPSIGEYTAKENITFTAVWEAPSTPTIEMVDVTFDMNGHGDSATKQTEWGKPITLIDDPAAEGYTFKGWTYDKEGNQAFDPKKNADQDTTLYAQWEKNADSTPTIEMVDVTFDMNGHGDSATKQTEWGKPITLIDDPAAEGYTFKGWTYDKEGNQAFDPKKNADQDTTLYAQWEKNADSTPINSTLPRTGDNQMALLASLCFSAAALSAVGIALTVYRKRKHV
ncbi:InlB B-repeat-containing protein [Ellagibacter isourolithinifaciens]|uniref:InlB B-repeat-containing protein n=1 Tax=Ellagibacter isourolithinifaciens TaxID=2137581 RepID=UPI003FD7E6B5